MNDDFDKSNITLKAAETFNDGEQDLRAKMKQLQVLFSNVLVFCMKSIKLKSAVMCRVCNRICT